MKRVNAVVIGAGAAGGIVAKELSTAGLSVVLLERGKWYTAADCRKDEEKHKMQHDCLSADATSARYNL